MIDELGRPIRPPYGSYESVVKVSRKLRDEGVPSVISNAAIGAVVGESSHLYSTKSAMQYFGLLDDDRPTERFIDLLRRFDSKAAWRELFDTYYPASVREGSPDAQSREEVEKLLSKAFPEAAETKTTIPKATIFMLKMAQHVGVSIPALGIDRHVNITPIIERPRDTEHPSDRESFLKPSDSLNSEFKYDYMKRFDFGSGEHVTLLYKLDPLGSKPERLQKLLQDLRQLVREYESGGEVDTS